MITVNQADFIEKDYFTDLSVLLDPYEYFDEIRQFGPVYPMKTHDALMVVGFDEAVQVLRNNKDFSSINSLISSAFPLPFTPQGSDISEQIEATRAKFNQIELLVAYDGAHHSFVRSIANRLLTPKRLKSNQEYIEYYAGKMVKEAVANGGCEMVNGIATPFVTMVIADLLGVPTDDRDKFREFIDACPPPGNMQESDYQGPSPLEFMAGFFYGYLEERRAKPGTDILSELATATYPDGELPSIEELVKLSTFMFAAGQDTSAKLLSNAARQFIEIPGMQDKLRAQPELIADFIEEVLRLEGSSKATHRLAVRDTKIGDMNVPAGTRVMVALAAANRDPRRFESPNEFILGRPRIKEHLAFARGVHTCAGAPLARSEVRIILEHFFRETSHIDMNTEIHGTPGNRRLNYEPSFIVRGMSEFHVTLTPT